MSRPTVEVSGARKLRRSLRRAGLDMTELRAVNQRVGAVVVNRATRTAPERTGLLASTIRAGAAQTNAAIRAGRARVPYAGPIHWGWPARGIAAQPWLSEAAQDTETQWVQLYLAELERLVNTIQGD